MQTRLKVIDAKPREGRLTYIVPRSIFNVTTAVTVVTPNGIECEFTLDAFETTSLGLENDFWDGEEDHAIFTSPSSKWKVELITGYWVDCQ